VTQDPSSNKQERIYSILRERILAGQYGPGHRLVIAAIARELEVSPMPVREAIRRLEAEGWVVYRRNQGAEVAPVDDGSWSETMSTLALLEGYATAVAAPLVTAGDFRALRQTNKRMLAALEQLNLVEVSRQNQLFHDTIVGRCPNRYLKREVDIAADRLHSLRATVFPFIPTRGKVSVDEHEELLEMMETGKTGRAIERFAREHKLHTLKAYEERRAAEAAA
jgi:DNA-binding GntR family transcriptional regulator